MDSGLGDERNSQDIDRDSRSPGCSTFTIVSCGADTLRVCVERPRVQLTLHHLQIIQQSTIDTPVVAIGLDRTGYAQRMTEALVFNAPFA